MLLLIACLCWQCTGIYASKVLSKQRNFDATDERWPIDTATYVFMLLLTQNLPLTPHFSVVEESVQLCSNSSWFNQCAAEKRHWQLLWVSNWKFIIYQNCFQNACRYSDLFTVFLIFRTSIGIFTAFLCMSINQQYEWKGDNTNE